MIEAILHDFRDAAVEVNAREISKEEFNLKMDLLAARIGAVRIDYAAAHIHAWQGHFTQLLFQTRFKAVEALQELKRTEGRRTFNNKVRGALETQLFFRSLHRTIEANTRAYQIKAGFYVKPHQVFVLAAEEKGGETHE